MEAAARAQPDGYTIVFASAGALVIVPHMQSNLRYDPFKDLAPISRVVGTQMVLVVGKHVKANTAKELQEYAKANPGRMTFGSTGSGSSVHLAGELFKMRAGIDVLHVPYRGGAPAVTALLSGEIDMLVVDLPVVASHIQSGAFKALGVASEQRSESLPDTPTVIEAGIAGVVSEGWYAMYAPAAYTRANHRYAACCDCGCPGSSTHQTGHRESRGTCSDRRSRGTCRISARRVCKMGRGRARFWRQHELMIAPSGVRLVEVASPAGFAPRHLDPVRPSIARWRSLNRPHCA